MYANTSAAWSEISENARGTTGKISWETMVSVILLFQRISVDRSPEVHSSANRFSVTSHYVYRSLTYRPECLYRLGQSGIGHRWRMLEETHTPKGATAWRDQRPRPYDKWKLKESCKAILHTSIGDNQVTIRSMDPAVILRIVRVGVTWILVKTVSLRSLGVVDVPSHLYVVVWSMSI